MEHEQNISQLHTEFWSEIQKIRVHLENNRRKWKGNIKMDLKKQGERMWIGFITLKIRAGVGILWKLMNLWFPERRDISLLLKFFHVYMLNIQPISELFFNQSTNIYDCRLRKKCNFNFLSGAYIHFVVECQRTQFVMGHHLFDINEIAISLLSRSLTPLLTHLVTLPDLINTRELPVEAVFSDRHCYVY